MTPWTAARQTPLFLGFSRQEYWSGLAFPPPGDLPNPDRTYSSTLAHRFFTFWATRVLIEHMLIWRMLGLFFFFWFKLYTQLTKKYLKKIKIIYYLFIYILVVLGLHCHAQASHWGGFFCCQAWALGQVGSVVVAHVLNSSSAYGIFLESGIEPVPLHWQADFLSTVPPGKYLTAFLNKDINIWALWCTIFHLVGYMNCRQSAENHEIELLN